MLDFPPCCIRTCQDQLAKRYALTSSHFTSQKVNNYIWLHYEQPLPLKIYKHMLTIELFHYSKFVGVCTCYFLVWVRFDLAKILKATMHLCTLTQIGPTLRAVREKCFPPGHVEPTLHACALDRRATATVGYN